MTFGLLFLNSHWRYYKGFWTQRRVFMISKDKTKTLRKAWFIASLKKELSLARFLLSILPLFLVGICTFFFKKDSQALGLDAFYHHLFFLIWIASTYDFLIQIIQIFLHHHWGGWIQMHPDEMRQCEAEFDAKRWLKEKASLEEHCPTTPKKEPPKRL